MRQRAFVFEDADTIRNERLEDVAGVAYERKNGMTYHQVSSALIETHEDRWWGFFGGQPKVSHRVMLTRDHGLPLEPVYGGRYGWRGPDPTESEAKLLSRNAHNVANAKAKVDAFGKSGSTAKMLQRPADILAFLMIVVAVSMICAVGYKAVVG